MSSEEETTPQQSADPGSEGEPEQSPGPQQPPQPVDVYTVLRFCIAQLAAAAWQKMGLQADPLTNEVHKDLDQARAAIDAATALADRLLPHLEGQEARDYQSLLTDLRLNFVNQSQEG